MRRGQAPDEIRETAAPSVALAAGACDFPPASSSDTAAEALAHVPSSYADFWKPLLDRVLAAFLTLVLAPLLAAVTLSVLVSLGRPVLFSQERVGQGGEAFRICKFRTMRQCRRATGDRRLQPGATTALIALPDQRASVERRRTHKHAADPRLVPVGRFLRRWSLDELPQLFNVIRGEMSLVGPRPELTHIVADYQPWQHRRHVVRPGVTGLWQVSDRGTDGSLMHERTDVDLRYVDELSLRLDVAILLRTLPAVLGVRRGV